jgi:hypothetical protein
MKKKMYNRFKLNKKKKQTKNVKRLIFIIIIGTKRKCIILQQQQKKIYRVQKKSCRASDGLCSRI